jgi:hypothetical protein
MQMLAGGGMPVTTDGVRQPDPSNPRGYFECEVIKRLGRGEDLRRELQDMMGTAVKIVAPLVVRLPPGLAYRVLFVRRDVDDIIDSQRRMMDRLGSLAGSDDTLLAPAIVSTWKQVREWVATDPSTALLELNYSDLIADSRAAGVAIDAFLGGGLDVDGIVASVDPALNRCAGQQTEFKGLRRATTLHTASGDRFVTRRNSPVEVPATVPLPADADRASSQELEPAKSPPGR